jgi:hypothetical protein
MFEVCLQHKYPTRGYDTLIALLQERPSKCTGHLNLRFTMHQLVTRALIAGSRGGDYQEYCLPEYDAV